LAQETHSPWTKILPIAPIRLRNTTGKQELTPFEYLYGGPFLNNDLLLDQETIQLIPRVIHLVYSNTLRDQASHPGEDIKGAPFFCPGDLLLKMSPNPAQVLNTPPWQRPYPVILSTLTAVQVAGLNSWIHHSRVKGWNPPVNTASPSSDPKSEPDFLM
jgi:hypothetical protein